MPIIQSDLSVQQPNVDVVKLFESFVSQRLPNNPQLKEIGGVYQFNLARNGHILASYSQLIVHLIFFFFLIIILLTDESLLFNSVICMPFTSSHLIS